MGCDVSSSLITLIWVLVRKQPAFDMKASVNLSNGNTPSLTWIVCNGSIEAPNHILVNVLLLFFLTFLISRLLSDKCVTVSNTVRALKVRSSQIKKHQKHKKSHKMICSVCGLFSCKRRLRGGEGIGRDVRPRLPCNEMTSGV